MSVQPKDAVQLSVRGGEADDASHASAVLATPSRAVAECDLAQADLVENAAEWDVHTYPLLDQRAWVPGCKAQRPCQCFRFDSQAQFAAWRDGNALGDTRVEWIHGYAVFARDTIVGGDRHTGVETPVWDHHAAPISWLVGRLGAYAGQTINGHRAGRGILAGNIHLAGNIVNADNGLISYTRRHNLDASLRVPNLVIEVANSQAWADADPLATLAVLNKISNVWLVASPLTQEQAEAGDAPRPQVRVAIGLLLARGTAARRWWRMRVAVRYNREADAATGDETVITTADPADMDEQASIASDVADALPANPYTGRRICISAEDLGFPAACGDLVLDLARLWHDAFWD